MLLGLGQNLHNTTHIFLTILTSDNRFCKSIFLSCFSVLFFRLK